MKDKQQHMRQLIKPIQATGARSQPGRQPVPSNDCIAGDPEERTARDNGHLTMCGGRRGACETV